MTNTKYKLYNVYQKHPDGDKFICEHLSSGVEVSEDIFWFDTYLEEHLSHIFDADDFYWEEEPDNNKTIQCLFSHSYFRGRDNPHECFAHLLGVTRNRAKELAVAISYYGVQATTTTKEKTRCLI